MSLLPLSTLWLICPLHCPVPPNRAAKNSPCDLPNYILAIRKVSINPVLTGISLASTVYFLLIQTDFTTVLPLRLLISLDIVLLKCHFAFDNRSYRRKTYPQLWICMCITCELVIRMTRARVLDAKGLFILTKPQSS